MTLMKRVSTLAFIVVLGVSGSALAQQPGPALMKQLHQMGGGQRMRSKALTEMYQKMQEILRHSKMMEGMTDQQQFMEEMKKHIRMTDTLMEQMMIQQHPWMVRPQPKPTYQESHPGKSQQVEPQASPEDTKQPEHQESQPGKSQ
ncbi:MAG: hypothetical protein KGL31_09320 [candidate division NC10 bacterium]|nr:hypothetical protein [candidate division NC10 bacterium]MDE2322098.1 hypothetical protein [candidate division NC10 bacterium]